MTRQLLLIDDDLLLGSLIRELVKPHGINVIQATNGVQGLALAGERHFDIIFVDLMLPQIDGLNVLRSLRDSHSLADTWVVAISGRSSVADQMEALLAGAHEFLTKPIDPTNLFHAVGVHS